MNVHQAVLRVPDGRPDPLGEYLAEIARIPLLTAEDEVRLARRVEAGVYAEHLLETGGATETTISRAELAEVARDGHRAKDHMIRANLRLVVSLARKFPQHMMPLLDLIQEGNLGLMHAVEKFDYTKGFKFSTYATWWIRQAIGRGLSGQGRIIRLPVHVVDDLMRLTRIERNLAGTGEAPTDEELAAEAGHSVGKVKTLRRLAREPISLDAALGEDGEATYGDMLADAEDVAGEIELQDLRRDIRARVRRLPSREALLLTLHYGLNDGRAHGFKEIGDFLGLTRQRVRQLHNQALNRLRDRADREPLLS
ncbi:sigma-70 family RNA polymerase sigma factor [Actinomadura barringtoniae]|uniref:Sigma-70 family RNA polymerase sigma factor n=1 Tax=Actinomadura barringtoniae TaxID=1427535 RepID=A0A939T932_9ACTN|nr:sigma-70 family RNA polymerase sigma factor [Actinomadura barringtoniae]MBO2453834.1 sigma-70 family RNA polymerase sigma factor [Actinomadura barringtoniae]